MFDHAWPCLTYRHLQLLRRREATMAEVPPAAPKKPSVKANKDKARKKEGSKALALKLIAKHTSATNAKEAQRTPWMAQMVQSIVNELTAELASQNAQLDALRSDATLTVATAKVANLEGRLKETEERASVAEQLLTITQAELVTAREGLQQAEASALAAAALCTSLQQAVAGVAQNDSRARRALALRASDLRDSLLRTRRELTVHRSVVRRQRFGMDQLKQQKEHELAEARSLIQALQQEQQIAARPRSQEKKSLVSRLSQPKQQTVPQSAPVSRAASPAKQAPAAAVTAAARPEAAKGGSKPASKGVEGTAQSPRIKSASSQQPVQKVPEPPVPAVSPGKPGAWGDASVLFDTNHKLNVSPVPKARRAAKAKT